MLRETQGTLIQLGVSFSFSELSLFVAMRRYHVWCTKFIPRPQSNDKGGGYRWRVSAIFILQLIKVGRKVSLMRSLL